MLTRERSHAERHARSLLRAYPDGQPGDAQMTARAAIELAALAGVRAGARRRRG